MIELVYKKEEEEGLRRRLVVRIVWALYYRRKFKVEATNSKMTRVLAYSSNDRVIKNKRRSALTFC